MLMLHRNMSRDFRIGKGVCPWRQAGNGIGNPPPHALSRRTLQTPSRPLPTPPYRVIPITDPEDPRIEPYRDVRERDLVGRDGLFIAEGAVVVRSLVQSNRYRARSLLIAEKRLEALEPMLAALPADTPVYTATQPVLDRIAGFPLHRGILAVGRRPVSPA